MLQRRRWCRHCDSYTLFARPNLDFGVGCLVTLVTGLLFLPVWVMIDVMYAFAPFRCQTCGGTYRTVLWGRKKKKDAPGEQAVRVVVVHAAPPAQPVPSAPAQALQAKAPPRPTMGPAQPFDWKGVGARIKAETRDAYASVAAAYRSLPEWATPIAWGLGVAAPVVTTMILLRYLLG